MQFHIQVNEGGYITDCIQAAHPGYIPITLNTPLPDKFNCGAYKYIGGNSYELDKAKFSAITVSDTDRLIEQLRADVDFLAIVQEVRLDV